MNPRTEVLRDRLARINIHDLDSMIADMTEITIAVRAMTIEDMREDVPPGVKADHLRVAADFFQASADATRMLADSLAAEER